VELAIGYFILPARPLTLQRACVAPDYDLHRERALVEAAQTGDRSALSSLLTRYGPSIFRGVLMPRLGHEARAQDALSETYRRVVTSIDRFQWQPAGIYPWLRTIAMRVAIDLLRKMGRERPLEPEVLERELDAQSDVEGTDCALIEAEESRIRKRQLAMALASINPRYAEAIRLRILDNQPREAVANAMGVTAATFDVLLHRALAALKKAMQTVTADGDDDDRSN
jgi:RNA polymerase sigma-70 factor (ECF subfamily)